MEEIENSKINKLIIIGNGFDLSLGLKTSYKDFLLWLLQKYIKKAYEQKYAPISKYKVINQWSKEEESLQVNGYFENEVLEITHTSTCHGIKSNVHNPMQGNCRQSHLFQNGPCYSANHSGGCSC